MQDVLSGNIFVGFKEELNANHEFVGRMHPFDGPMDFGLVIEARQSTA